MKKINSNIKNKVIDKKKKNMFEVKKSSKPINKKRKTNNKDLFEYSLVKFTNNGFLIEEASVDFRRNQHDEDAITEYENNFMNLGQPIYRAVFKKNLKEKND